MEYFELTDERMRARLEQSVVALTGAGLSGRIAAGDTGSIPTWGEADELCPEERFSEQPAAVFCSGVLVDWDLVLTSGHCTDMVPTSELRVVFDYYYRNPGELAASERSVYEVLEVIIAEDDRTSSNGLDYAWLRLREVARPPHRPAAIYTNDSGIALGDHIINIGSGGGIPRLFRRRGLRRGPGRGGPISSGRTGLRRQRAGLPREQSRAAACRSDRRVHIRPPRGAGPVCHRRAKRAVQR